MVKLLVMDVDGTLTDGKIYMGSDGEQFKAFDIKDGCGIHDLLIPKGICPVIITGRNSAIVLRRCEELGIKELYQGVKNKQEQLTLILKKHQYSYTDVAYIGDDINDLPCMMPVKHGGGVIGCPSDAVEDVKAVSDYICNRKGGDGAVREFIEWLLKR